MQVAVKDQQDTYRPYLPLEEHVGNSTVKADKQAVTCLEEKGSTIITKKTQNIESLLPDEEDLFSGVIDELGSTATTNGNDEDFDLFGMELEGNSNLYFRQQNSEVLTNDQNNSDYCCMKDRYIVHNTISPDAILHANSRFTNSLPSIYNYNQYCHGPYYSTASSVGFATDGNLMLGPYGPSMEHMIRGLSGHHHSFQNHHLNPVIRSHSPPFHEPFNSSLLSCNDLHFAYMDESSKADLILNPLRIVGFPSTIMCSPQIISRKSPEKDKKSTLPSSVNRPRGRIRRISNGRHETVLCHVDDKKYELDIERVLRGEDCRTTLMIKNIPNKYSSAMLLAAIDEHNQGTYDFIYLPLDFKNKCNMGYAFINMIDPLQIVRFHKSFNGKKWEKFHSGKVACLAYARIQGKAALIAHFQESSLMNEDKCCHPILFTTDGNQEPFPLGPNIHSRRHKNKCNTTSL